MKIIVTTTIDIDKDESAVFTTDEIDLVYKEFTQIISDTHKSGDLTSFVFINTHTNMQIEDELVE